MELFNNNMMGKVVDGYYYLSNGDIIRDTDEWLFGVGETNKWFVIGLKELPDELKKLGMKKVNRAGEIYSNLVHSPFRRFIITQEEVNYLMEVLGI